MNRTENALRRPCRMLGECRGSTCEPSLHSTQIVFPNCQQNVYQVKVRGEEQPHGAHPGRQGRSYDILYARCEEGPQVKEARSAQGGAGE
jgi:hypothetical protein